MIVETKDNDWKPTSLQFAKAKYPQSPNMALPRNYWVACIVGSRNSGKTFAITQLVKQMEQSKAYSSKGEHPIRTILISPTAGMNPVYSALKSLDEDDIHLTYSDELVKEILDDIKQVREEASQYQDDLALYKKARKIKNMEDLTGEEIIRLEQMNFEPPIPPRYPIPPVNVLILDDLVGSDAYKQGRSPLTNYILRNRHFDTCFALLTQSLKQIPKTLRQNANVFMLFKYANSKNVVDDLYPEVSSVIKEDDFVDLYEHATHDLHGFLMVDFTKPNPLLFRKGFDTYISVDD